MVVEHLWRVLYRAASNKPHAMTAIFTQLASMTGGYKYDIVAERSAAFDRLPLHLLLRRFSLAAPSTRIHNWTYLYRHRGYGRTQEDQRAFWRL